MAPVPDIAKTGAYWCLMFLCLGMISLSAACGDIRPRMPAVPDRPEAAETAPVFETKSQTTYRYATPEQIRAFSESDSGDAYRIGPGDTLSLTVWGRPEISDPSLKVGPDGVVTVPRIGSLAVAGATRDMARDAILEKLQAFYSQPEITLSITDYTNNKAYVLGRVENPGMVRFPGKGTLLEALAIAGGYSTEAEDTYLTRCAIIRGHDTIIWVDLSDLLLNGNMALNARIFNDDVIFIPESQSELVYVMGEVRTPGAYYLTGQLTVLDSIMLAGGPTRDADTTTLYLIRKQEDGSGDFREINLKEILETADYSRNYLMKDDDIIYVSEKRISRFNYVLNKIFPSMEIFYFGSDVLEKTGVMQELRQRMWGQ